MKWWVAVACYEAIIQIGESAERWDVYKRAERHAKNAGVPLIVVGCPKWGLHHGHGDATIDLVHKGWCRCPNPVVQDVRTIDKALKGRKCVMFSSHVLEHLDPKDAEKAMEAMDQVAIAQYHCYPSKLSLSAWAHPAHKSWPHNRNNQLTFENRTTRNK